jgi:hypothetical protein
VFDPAGYVGLGYWYLLCPVHELAFAGMFRGIVHAAGGAVRGQLPSCSRLNRVSRRSWRSPALRTSSWPSARGGGGR